MAASGRPGDVISVRSADDVSVGFDHWDDAQRFGRKRPERFAKCKVARHPETTRLSESGRLAADRRRRRAQGKPAPCDFLGFPPIGRTTRQGQFTVRRTTIAQRLRKKLHAGKETRRRMHWPSPPPGAWLQSVLLGPYRYYGVPRTGGLLTVCRDTIMR
jgi:hypothetical protein